MSLVYAVLVVLLLVAGLGLASCARDLNIERGVVFAEPGGERLKLDVYRKPQAGEGLRPGMLVIHGGAWRIGPRTQQAWYCRQFARNGYVVMTIDYRMMPKYPFPHCLHDCKAGVRWMRRHAEEYGIDPERIVTFGASAGGHLAAFLAATTPEDGFEGTENLVPSSSVRAAAILYGAVDLTKYHRKSKSGKGKEREGGYMRRFVGDAVAKEGQDPFAAASPITYAKPGMCPVHLTHGTRDHLVSYRQSRDFFLRLQELGVPARLVTYPGRDHGFDYIHWKERKALFADMLAFLKEHGDK